MSRMLGKKRKRETCHACLVRREKMVQKKRVKCTGVWEKTKTKNIFSECKRRKKKPKKLLFSK